MRAFTRLAGGGPHLVLVAIGVNLHVEDVLNVLRYEDLRNVILVGHSYGGMVITGVAGRVAKQQQYRGQEEGAQGLGDGDASEHRREAFPRGMQTRLREQRYGLLGRSDGTARPVRDQSVASP